LDQAAVGVVSGVVSRHASRVGQEAGRTQAIVAEVRPARPLPLTEDIQPHQIIGVAAGGELPKHLRQPILGIEQVVGLNTADSLTVSILI